MGDWTRGWVKVVWVPDGKDAEVIEALTDGGWLQDDEPSTDPTANHWQQDEVRCGTFDDILGSTNVDFRVLQQFEDLGVAYYGWEEPKYEWLGTLRKFAPRLGVFMVECDADGNELLTPGWTKEMLAKARTLNEARAALARKIGAAWDAEFQRLWAEKDEEDGR